MPAEEVGAQELEQEKLDLLTLARGAKP